MLYVHTQAGWQCRLCGRVITYGRGDNLARPAHARRHVREGLLEERGRRHSRGALQFELTAAGHARLAHRLTTREEE